MDKRGQFFLIAAIVAIGIFAGLTTVFNYARTNPPGEQFYDLTDEVGFETKRVIDYGIYSASETDSLVDSFLSNYSDYLGQDQAVFIYGNSSNVVAIFFDASANIGSIEIGSGQTLPVSGGEINVQNVASGENIENVVVNVSNLTYDFELRQGQNFFFVVVKEENDEKFVAVG